MSVLRAVYSRLSSDTSLTALVGERIYPAVRPQDTTLPAVTYYHSGSEREYGLTYSSGLVSAFVTIESWATTIASALAVAAAVRGAMDNYSGTSGTVVVDHVDLNGEQDVTESSADAEEFPVFGVSQDFNVWYQE